MSQYFTRSSAHFLIKIKIDFDCNPFVYGKFKNVYVLVLYIVSHTKTDSITT